MPVNSVIPALAAGAREPCLVSPHARCLHLLPEADRAWIETERIHVFLPVTGSRADSSLVGMIALKERRNALGYTEDDMRFLRAAAASASLACEALTTSREGPASAGEPEEMAIECARCGRVTVWQRRRATAAEPGVLLSRPGWRIDSTSCGDSATAEWESSTLRQTPSCVASLRPRRSRDSRTPQPRADRRGAGHGRLLTPTYRCPLRDRAVARHADSVHGVHDRRNSGRASPHGTARRS